jgi:hypothetical protein
MDTALLIWIELDDTHHPLRADRCPCAAASATKVEPRHGLRMDDGQPGPENRRRRMIRDTEDYLSNPLSKSWARLSSLRPPGDASIFTRVSI